MVTPRNAVPILAIVWSVLPIGTSAQEIDPASLHQQGVEAFAAGDLEAAQRSFETALEAAARPSTAFNLALVLRMQGNPGGARTLVDRALGEEFGVLSERERPELERLANELDQEVGELTVRGYGAERLTFQLDDDHHWEAREGEERTLFVEPGDHRVRASAAERTSAHTDVRIEAGGLRVVSLRLLPPAIVREVPMTDEEPSSNPLPLILGISGGVAALVGAIVLVVVLTGSDDPEPDVTIQL